LFEELLALRHLHRGLRRELLKWARRWKLVDANNTIPPWLDQQIAAAF